MERPVEFSRDGLRLYGVLDAPDGARHGMVLVHGWSGYRIGPHRLLVDMSRRLAAAGFAVLRFDLRGRGDSEGEEVDTDLDGMIADTSRAVAFLRRETGIDDVALLGICSGANVAIGAATLDAKVRDLVLWSPLPFQPDVGKKQERRRTRFYALEYVRKVLRPQTWLKLVRGRVNFGVVRRVLFPGKPAPSARNLKDSRRNIMAAFASFRGRALFIHGEKDPEAVPAREIFMPFCERYDIASEFHLVEGANHSFYSLAWTDHVASLSLDWLQRSPAPEPAP